MSLVGVSIWKEHEGLLIPEDVEPLTPEERAILGAGDDPYVMDPEEWLRDWKMRFLRIAG